MMRDPSVDEETAVQMIKSYNTEPDKIKNTEMERVFIYHENGIPKFYGDDDTENDSSKGVVGIRESLVEPISPTNSFLYDGRDLKFWKEGENWWSKEVEGWKNGFKGIHRLRARLGLFENRDWFHEGVIERVSQYFVNAGILTESKNFVGGQLPLDRLQQFLTTKDVDLPPPSYKGVNDLPSLSYNRFRGTKRRGSRRTSRRSSASKRSRRRRSRRRSPSRSRR